MRRALAASARRTEGQAIVELAVILPIFLLLMVGIIEVAGAWQTLQVVTNASREVARRAVMPGSTPVEVSETLFFYLDEAGFDPERSTLVIRCCTDDDEDEDRCPDDWPCSPASGRPIRVDLAYPYMFRTLGPVVNLACSGCGNSWREIPLRSVTVMRNE